MKQMCHGCRNRRHLVRRVSAFEVVVGGLSVADQTGIIWAKKEIINASELEMIYYIINAHNRHECVCQVLGTMDHMCHSCVKDDAIFPSYVQYKRVFNASLHACECANGDPGNMERLKHRLSCAWILKCLYTVGTCMI